MDKNAIVALINERYAAIRDSEQEDLLRRRREARKNPEFAKAEDAFNESALALAKVKARRQDDKTAQENYEIAKKNYEQVIGKYGFDLSLHVKCKRCNDTGFVKGKPCSCAQQLYLDIIRKQNGNGKIPHFTFDDNTISQTDCKQQKQLCVLYDKMREFCEKFYGSQIKFVLLCGQSGTGKTSLAYAMCNALLDKGVTVCFVTAFEFNNLILRYHTTPVAVRSQYLDSVLDCDFLVIDDLGTEPMLKSVTKEYLYNVVDTRVNSGKKTMVTSNLSLEELMLRYGERTISRMTNKSYSLTRQLLGDDLRKK